MTDDADLDTATDGIPAPEAGGDDSTLDAALRSAYDELSAVEGAIGRDEKGRFAPKAAQPQAQAEAQPATEEGPPEQQAVEVPPSWSKRAALWQQASPELREAIVARENEMAAGVARFKGCAEFADMAERNGMPLAEVLRTYVQVERMLATDPENTIRELAARYGVDLSAPQQQPQKQPAKAAAPQAPAVPPELDRRLSAIEQRFVSERVNAFFGDPKNKYANEPGVAEAMADAIRAERMMGREPDLSAIYERAIWALPEVRSKIIADQKAEEAKKVIPKTQAVATAARTASKSLAGSGSGSPPAAKPKSLEDTLKDNYARLAS